MGERRQQWLWAALLVSLAACTPDDPAPNAPVNGTITRIENAAPAHVAADAPLAEWIVGAWSFDTSCVTDFVMRYDADGALDNAGEVGRWALAGDQVTETVTERLENGGETPVKLDPPVVRSYALKRIDAAHGVITYRKRDVPIQRC